MAETLDFGHLLDTPLAVLILNEYLMTVGAVDSLKFWKAGRKFMLTYRGKVDVQLGKAKKVYDTHLAGRELEYVSTETVAAIGEVVSGDGSDLSAHLFRDAMKEAQDYMAGFSQQIQESSFWPRMSSALSDVHAKSAVRDATARARTTRLPPPPPKAKETAAAAPAAAEAPPAPEADTAAAEAEAAAAEAEAEAAAAAEAEAAAAAAALEAEADAEAAAEAEMEDDDDEGEAEAEAPAPAAADDDDDDFDDAEAEAEAEAAAAAPAPAPAPAPAAAAKPAAAPAAGAGGPKAGPRPPSGGPSLPVLRAHGSLQLLPNGVEKECRYFGVLRPGNKGKLARRVLQIDFVNKRTRIRGAEHEKFDCPFNALMSDNDVRVHSASRILAYDVETRRFVVSLGSAMLNETVIAATPEEAYVIRALLQKAYLIGQADIKEAAALAGAGAPEAEVTVDEEAKKTVEELEKAGHRMPLGKDITEGDLQHANRVGLSTGVHCGKLDIKGSFKMYKTFFFLLLDTHLMQYPLSAQVAVEGWVEAEKRRRQKPGPDGGATAVPEVPLPFPIAVYNMAGMKTVRQGNTTIAIDMHPDGLWCALKAKVARVLQDRAATRVTDDENKEQIPPTSAYNSRLTVSVSVRGADTIQTDSWLKKLRPATRRHCTGVIYNPMSLTTHMWFGCGKNGVPACINAALNRIESDFMDTPGLYRVPGDRKNVAKMLDLFHATGRTPVFIDTKPHDLTGFVKKFFINLASSLLGYHNFFKYLEAAEASDPQCEAMWALVNVLPLRNKATLRRMATHLRRVSHHHELNKMTVDSLAVSFGAVLVRAEDPNVLRANIKRLAPVVRKLINMNWDVGSGVL